VAVVSLNDGLLHTKKNIKALEYLWHFCYLPFLSPDLVLLTSRALFSLSPVMETVQSFNIS